MSSCIDVYGTWKSSDKRTIVKLYACGVGDTCDTYRGEEKCGKPEGRGSLGKCRPRWQDNMKLDSLICVETKGL
jgi:hypothetical protein